MQQGLDILITTLKFESVMHPRSKKMCTRGAQDVYFSMSPTAYTVIRIFSRNTLLGAIKTTLADIAITSVY